MVHLKAVKDKRLIIIFLTVFIDLVGFGIIIPLNPYLAEAFGASPFQVGMLMGVYSLMQFIFSPVWGQISDRIGRRPVILISLIGAGISHTAFGFAGSLTGLIFARAMAGLFGGNISTAMAYIADITPSKDRSKGMGMVGAAFGLGFICGPLLGGISAQVGKQLGSMPPFGESFPAVIAGLICLLNAGMAFLYLPESKAPGISHREVRGLRFRRIYKALFTPVLSTLMLLTFLNTFAMAHIEASLFLFVQDKWQWSLTQASFGFAYIGLILVFTQGYLIRKWMPRLGEKKMLIAGIGFSLFGFVLMSISGPLALLAVGVTLLGLGNGMATPSLSGSVSLMSGEDVQGNNLGVAQSLSSLARILGPPSGGWLYQQMGHGSPFAAAATVSTVGLLLALVSARRLPEKGKVS
jgi:MFS transporter, DHA1 family, tetracycline resistance protein